MPRLSVFNYSSSHQFLVDSVARARAGENGPSIRELAKLMGFASHALLIMLLSKKRPLRVKHAPSIGRAFALDASEVLYLQALIQLNNSSEPEEIKLCQRWLSSLHPLKKFDLLELDHLKYASDWIHSAVLAACELKIDCRDELDIQTLLRSKRSLTDIRDAIERLKLLGLLLLKPNGSLQAIDKHVSTPNDVVNLGARAYLAAVVDLAKEAITTQQIEEREFQSFSIAMKMTDLPDAKDFIRSFKRDFIKRFGSRTGDEVYQFNLQLFQLTESRAHLRAKDEGADTGNGNDPASHAGDKGERSVVSI